MGTPSTTDGEIFKFYYLGCLQNIKKLVKDEGSTYARNHPPKNVTREKWIELIDGKWSDENWLVINTLKILITSEVCSHLSLR